MNYFKKNLRFIIKKFDTTQARLAFQMNKSQNTISNWINENNYPDLEDLIKINRIFGISIDALAYTDLESGNLITESHIEDFRKNGNVTGNPIGNLKAVSKEYFKAENQEVTLVNERDEAGQWATITILRKMDEKLDFLVLSAGKGAKKGGK